MMIAEGPETLIARISTISTDPDISGSVEFAGGAD